MVNGPAMTEFHRPLSANTDKPGTHRPKPASGSVSQAPDEWTSSGNFSCNAQALNGRRSPGRGQRHLHSRPVLEHVTHASRMSGPPKQMFVVMGSGKGMCSYSPLGSNTVIPPFQRVPT